MNEPGATPETPESDPDLAQPTPTVEVASFARESAVEPEVTPVEREPNPAQPTVEVASLARESAAEMEATPEARESDPGQPTVEFAPFVPEPAAEPEAPARPGLVRRARLAFRSWRRGRPFWGGVFVLLGAAEILYTYSAPLGVVLHFGLYGLAGYLVPGMLGLLGFLIIFDPVHRTFYSVLAVLAALGTWLTSNLGGFIIGMLLGMLGGSMAFGWQYGERAVRGGAGGRKRRLRPRARARAAD